MKLYDYAGVIHFHSEFSFDGRDSIPAILAAARENGIDFLMLTDHSHLKARDAGFEGWHDDVFLIVGQEITPGQFNHYLAFDIRKPIGGKDCPPQAMIDRVQNQGGFGFIAHPDHEGTEMFHVKPFPWTHWEVSGHTGVGIWDFMTDWQSSLNGYGRAFLSYLFPALFLRGPRPMTLQRWDEMNRVNRVVGIGELDNHNTQKRLFGLNLEIFPFAKAFRYIRTHILTELPFQKDAGRDTENIFSSLKRGRAYIAQEYFHPAKGFYLSLREGEKEATMGDEFFLQSKALMTVRLPCRGKIHLLKNGERLGETVSDRLEYTIQEKGVYRIEVFLRAFGRYRPWIFSNPIYVQ